jgi:cell wall-associated NlpC family hydrolase
VILPPPPPNDGALPSQGQIDAYLQLNTQRELLVVRIATTRTKLVTARALITALNVQAVYSSSSVHDTLNAMSTTKKRVDRVASQIYQQGDGGLGAIASVLTGGPDSFLQRLDQVQLNRTEANRAVHEAQQARTAAALAEVQDASISSRITRARLDEISAMSSLKVLVAQLALVNEQISAIDVTAPQQAVGPDGCPTSDVPNTLRGGSAVFGAAKLCQIAVSQAATPQAALAIKWAFLHLGAAYACGGAGRMEPFRMDCSSFVSRAYAEGAGLNTAGANWAPSTRNMVPWDGVALDPHYAYVAPANLRAGDLVLYDTCPQGGCPYKHVVMYLGSPDGGKTFWMMHTNSCGDVAKVEPFLGFPTVGEPFLVARRVMALPGEVVHVPAPKLTAAQAMAAAALKAKAKPSAKPSKSTKH